MEHVILCHGWDGRTNWGPIEWTTLKPILESASYDVWTPSLDRDNILNATIIETVVDMQPAGEPVHLISHSMGGLSSRWYMKHLAGHERITSYIALDAPHFGVSWWKAVWFGNTQLWSGSQFMADLNAPDATPGSPPYVQLTCDYPQLLPGVFWKALEGVTHKNMVTDPATIALLLQLLEGDYTALAVN